MAVTATTLCKEWLKTDAAREFSPAERSMLFWYCEGVNEKRLEATGESTVWIAQRTLSQIVGVSTRHIRRANKKFEERGLLIDTGLRVGRGVIKWEVGMEELEDRTPMSTVDTHVQGKEEDTTEEREKEAGEPHTGHPRPPGRTSESDPLDMEVRSIGHPGPTEPEVNPEGSEQEVNTGRSPSAHDASSTDLQQNSNDKQPSYLEAKRDELRSLLRGWLGKGKREEYEGSLQLIEDELNGTSDVSLPPELVAA
jgi:hypothetical protein